jgi:hypothetical protein
MLEKRFQDKRQVTFILNKGDNDNTALDKTHMVNVAMAAVFSQPFRGADAI